MDGALVVVVNPKAGRGRGEALARVVERRLVAAGRSVDVVATRASGHATDVARARPDAGAWVVVGGDGTLHEVVQGLMTHARRAPVALVPAGSGNALAHDLDLRDDLSCVDALVAGSLAPLDVLQVDGDDGRRVFAFNVVGVGMAADVARRAERWRRLGGARYTCASLVDVARATRHDLRLVIDDEVVDGPLLFACACNTVHTGRGMAMAPGASFGDGLVDVVAVRPMGRIAMARLLARVFDGSHVDDARVELRRARRVRFESSRPGPLNVDGDVAGATPVEVVVRPTALMLAVPQRTGRP